MISLERRLIRPAEETVGMTSTQLPKVVSKGRSQQYGVQIKRQEMRI